MGSFVASFVVSLVGSFVALFCDCDIFCDVWIAWFFLFELFEDILSIVKFAYMIV